MFEEKTKIGDSFKMSGTKKTEEGLKICGKVRLIGSNYNKNGVLEQVFDFEVPNLITYAGFDAICAQIGSTTQPDDFHWMAIGDGEVQDINDTLLTHELARVASTYAHTPGELTFTETGVFTSVTAATNYGCFNVVTANTATMLNTAGFDAITIDSLTIICTVTLS